MAGAERRVGGDLATVGAPGRGMGMDGRGWDGKFHICKGVLSCILYRGCVQWV